MSTEPVTVIVPDNAPVAERVTDCPPVGGNLRDLVAGVLRVHPDTLLPRDEPRR